MRPWFQLPVKDRMELLREYKKLGYSYSNAVKDFEDSLPKYEGGGTLTSQIPTQQPASSTNVVGRNPIYEMQLMQRDQLKQNLFQQASQGNPEAEQQFREIFGISTHRYRYDNDPQYREQTQTNMREHTGAKIDYPSTDLRKEGNITPNTAWMYPQLKGKGKQAMTEFSNQVIETALPIPGIDKINKAAKIINAKRLNKADDVIKYFDDYSKLSQKEVVELRAKRLLNQKEKWANPKDINLELNLQTARQSHYDDLTTAQWNEKFGDNFTPENLGVNKYNKTVVFDDAPLTPLQKNKISAHETGHYYLNTFDEGLEWNSVFDLSKLPYRTKNYLKGKGMTGRGSIMGDELTQRAGQLKDYIAIKNNIPLDKDFIITPSQLDDALKNYVNTTGLDNNMTQFVSAIKDKKGLLDLMNTKPLSILPPTAIVVAPQLQEKEFGGIISIEPLKRRRRK
jgi:hypothetical protein